MYNWNILWLLCGIFGILLLLGFYLTDLCLSKCY